MSKERMDEKMKSEAIDLLENAMKIVQMPKADIIKRYDLDEDASNATAYAVKCGAMESCISQALFCLHYDTEKLINEMAEYYGEA